MWFSTEVLADLNAMVQIVVGSTLLLLASAVLIHSRRRGDDVILAFFLLLVGLNFLFNVLPIGLVRDTGVPWRQWAAITLALDPFFLLYFASIHPFRGRRRRVQVLLVASAGLGLVGAFMATFYWGPTSAMTLSPAATPFYLTRVVLIGHLAFAYAMAWCLAVRSLAEAPTAVLRRQASWLVVAVGTVVLARVGLVWVDLRVHFLADVSTYAGALPFSFANMLLPVGLYVWALREVRRAGDGDRRLLRPVRLAGAVGLVLLFTQAVMPALGETFRSMPLVGVAYSLRWLVFGGILTVGILSYEVVDPRRSLVRAMARAAAVAGAITLALLTRIVMTQQGADGPEALVVLPAAVGIAAVVPLDSGVRSFLARLGSPSAHQDHDRRLFLDRAALEAAWARGPPDSTSRHELERDRRAFGVTLEEGRALEHVVRTQLAGVASPLGEGDEVLPGLVVERELGRGAHGRALLAWDHHAGRHRVVKEMLATHGLDADVRQRLWSEVGSLERLHSPHIVSLHGHHVLDGRTFLVLDYVPGTSLNEILVQSHVAENDVRIIIHDLLAALEVAHATGVTHRDVKPANVIVDDDGRAHLTDFGLAVHSEVVRGVTATGSALLAPGEIVGTLAYLSPEQARGARAGPEADMYALGIVLTEMLTGRHPVDLKGYDVPTMIALLRDPQPDLKGVPAPWRPLVDALLHPDPVARPSARAARGMVPES